MNTQKKNISGRKKAAIFIVSLGPDLGSTILKHLKDDEVETVSFEIARLSNVTLEERQEILKEFYEFLEAQKYILTGGIDYANEILERSLGVEKSMDILNRLTSNLQIRPFDFVRKADPQNLVNLLQSEHPQTIALVMTYLESVKAAEILSQLPSHLQADVARRIATMNRTTPEALREVESVLEKKISSFDSEDLTITGGIDATAEILNSTDRTTEKSIIETLEEEDPELAEEIKKRMFIFEDIIALDDIAIQKVLRKVENEDLVKALKSVDEEVKEKIFSNMSKRASQLIEEDIDYMGPIKLTDVEEAQQRIVNMIRKLESEGEIVIVRSGEADVLV